MLLAVDIGNTNMVFGIFSKEKLIKEMRVVSVAQANSEIALENLRVTLSKAGKIDRVAVASVVPELNSILAATLQTLTGCEVKFIGTDISYGIALNLRRPEQVGADRVVNAVAAQALYGEPAIVVDFGTATTFDVLSAGAYQGGIIAPGVRLAMEALASKAAQLSEIELSWPQELIGKDTVSAMQSGSVRGYLALVDGLIEQLKAELQGVPDVIATGGLGALFAKHSKWISKYDPHLTLQGIRILADRNS